MKIFGSQYFHLSVVKSPLNNETLRTAQVQNFFWYWRHTVIFLACLVVFLLSCMRRAWRSSWAMHTATVQLAPKKCVAYHKTLLGKTGKQTPWQTALENALDLQTVISCIGNYSVKKGLYYSNIRLFNSDSDTPKKALKLICPQTKYVWVLGSI